MSAFEKACGAAVKQHETADQKELGTTELVRRAIEWDRQTEHGRQHLGSCWLWCCRRPGGEHPEESDRAT